jgi:hypothetical protein
MAEYFEDFLLSDTVAPAITGDTLPGEGSTQSFVYPYFTLNFSEDMLASTVNAASNYELLGSGGDGTFADGNEVVYTVSVGSYSSGLSNSYSIPDGPLQPDDYRLRVTTGLKDKLNNPLAAEHVRSWTVESVPGYVFEDRETRWSPCSLRCWSAPSSVLSTECSWPTAGYRPSLSRWEPWRCSEPC